MVFSPTFSIYEKIQNPLILAFEANKYVQLNFLKYLFFFEFLVHYYEFMVIYYFQTRSIGSSLMQWLVQRNALAKQSGSGGLPQIV